MLWFPRIQESRLARFDSAELGHLLARLTPQVLHQDEGMVANA